jgi:hypothetical protein
MNIYNLIFEAEKGSIPEIQDDDVRVGKKTRLAKDSVDDQIDSLLIKYESESLRSDEDESMSLEESYYNKSLKALLLEEEAIDPAADEEATTGSEIIDEKEPAEEEMPNLDIDQFSSKVARLVMNFQQLLKVETAIVNRASEFINKNYDKEHIERFYAILEEQYDIQIEEEFVDEDMPSSPLGLGAYDAGSGTGAG